MTEPTNKLLEMKGIDKSFPGVHALKRVDLCLEEGEVLALVGENGAGKSTLIKALGGAHIPDEGEILIDGQPATITTPTDSQMAGIAIIYQEFNLIPELTVRENIFLGRETTKFGFCSARRELEESRTLFERIGVALDPDTKCSSLTVAQQQMVEIAKALSQDARILVMDEPTAALTQDEVEKLLEIIRELRANGIGIIYISHRLDEIDAIADRITVLRDGESVGDRSAQEISRQNLIALMVGRTLEEEFPERTPSIGEEKLRVESLNRDAAVYSSSR